jgi:hypothetical protein
MGLYPNHVDKYSEEETVEHGGQHGGSPFTWRVDRHKYAPIPVVEAVKPSS